MTMESIIDDDACLVVQHIQHLSILIPTSKICFILLQNGYNFAGGLSDIVSGMSLMMRSTLFDSTSFVMGPWGFLGAGVMDGIMGISELVSPEPDSSAWIAHRVEVYLNNLAEYLICEFREIMGEYFEEYMGQNDLKEYNQAMAGLQSYWMTGCQTRRCLNESQTDPVKRTGDCCVFLAKDHQDCKRIGTNTLAKCTGGENNTPGVCGSDHACYHCYGFDEAVEDAEKVLDIYASNSAINFGEQTNQYNGTDAFLAEAKSATFIMSIYQHLHFLGTDKNYNGVMKAFANKVST